MKSLSRVCRLVVALAVLSLGVSVPTARAADPYTINTILSLTGSYAFIGTTQLQALQALAGYVNKTGGISGRTLAFSASDDQSDPKVSVQLAQGLIAKHVPIILGSSSPGSCAAMTPLVEQNGPILYCLANAGHPTPGGYVFLTLYSAEAQMGVALRYFRLRGWNRIAYIVSSQADGQDAEKALLAAAAEPSNKSVQIVAREHFTPGDLSVTAQMASIKAAKPDAIVAWAAGTTAGTLFHGAQDANLDVPTVTSPGNLNAAFFKQYATLLPKQLYFSAAPYYGADTLADRGTKAKLATLSDVLAGVGAKPDQIEISAWDPGSLLVDALRKLGADATPAQLRAYLVAVKGWVGVNGAYDFGTDPQRGIGEKNVIVVKWDGEHNAFTGVSKFGGTPIAGK
jgi:branched-chain amino acid transport system substrate-binding protein